MKAFVTGGGGFLGSAIVRQLVDKGVEVTVFGRNYYPHLEKLRFCCWKLVAMIAVSGCKCRLAMERPILMTR